MGQSAVRRNCLDRGQAGFSSRLARHQARTRVHTVPTITADTPEIIIFSLGTNDDNDGNMTTIQAEMEEQLGILVNDHPTSALYVMNILPRWTDETGETEKLKDNIRTAISAACTAQGIPCWDTYSAHLG